MANFKVVWEIDISGVNSPVDAAKEAWSAMQAEGSQANYFTVTNEDTGQEVNVDLQTDG